MNFHQKSNLLLFGGDLFRLHTHTTTIVITMVVINNGIAIPTLIIIVDQSKSNAKQKIIIY